MEDKKFEDFGWNAIYIDGHNVEEIRKELESQMQMEAVRNDVLGDKVYKFLAGVNKAEETKMSKKEYEASKAAANSANAAVSEEKEEKPKKKTAAKKTETETEDKPKKTRTSKKKEESAE